MRLSNVVLTMLTLNLSVLAHAKPPGRAAAEIVPGTLVIIGTPMGAFSEVVLENQGSRNLVLRFGQGRWEPLEHLTSEFSGARLYAPLENPYASVLVPVRSAPGEAVTSYEVRTAAYTTRDNLARHYIIGGDGQVYGIGLHTSRDVLATDGFSQTVKDNIPVKIGQTLQEAILAHNQLLRDLGVNEVVNENVKIDRSGELNVLDHEKARAEADAELAKIHDTGVKRAERAERAERGAGERPRVEDAVRKGKDVR